MISVMDWVSSNGSMVTSILAILFLISVMAKENIFGVMGIFMKETGTRI